MLLASPLAPEIRYANLGGIGMSAERGEGLEKISSGSAKVSLSTEMDSYAIDDVEDDDDARFMIDASIRSRQATMVMMSGRNHLRSRRAQPKKKCWFFFMSASLRAQKEDGAAHSDAERE